ncbi:hypothetical protein M2101_000556 [Parabacteroides sp. PM5-20]|uniref:peptidoglycan bridge formation glycyltransferase FemA/FemB family protein n=1 Tax=Parabacteroides sp. PM5-20 TaxID=2940527 RepID=UPI0024760288|nr:peptidoglycan bridge formation glycyltransferase FemA/FemB family protein [Parabacteroides sp. PM5-20]MDH6533904.1 hypothetical protein [Parabacteroides sp. PM5-20]
MTDKDKYRLLCNTEKSIPLFSRDWWLDIVCGEANWDVLWIEQKGQVQAVLPFYVPYKGLKTGFRQQRKGFISMPPYTQTMGPWFAPIAKDTKYTTELGLRQALCKQFTERLQSYTFFLQNFHYDITDWLPFYWQGYKQTTRYTYILSLTDTEKVWDNMSQHTRRNINKAQEKLQIKVIKGIPVDDFLQIVKKTFKRQGKSSIPNTSILKKIIISCREREQGDIWGGYDEVGNLHAAIFVAWQESAAYYIAGGGDPAYRDSGAHSLIMWEAIRFTADKSELFDFEGSMLPGVERFFREFGAKQIPYFTISKGKRSLLHRAYLKVKSLV